MLKPFEFDQLVQKILHCAGQKATLPKKTSVLQPTVPQKLNQHQLDSTITAIIKEIGVPAHIKATPIYVKPFKWSLRILNY